MKFFWILISLRNVRVDVSFFHVHLWPQAVKTWVARSDGSFEKNIFLNCGEIFFLKTLMVSEIC
eukprot:TRINITY_DN5880_c0_g1_i1.p1 TRINITY_DN5880_c0_g1~~TRINITY_DN5880_c0_g1_i1.p1  ORF type:complete len:64 (+),score=1.22 TRINITY_DN5880_c0_g1_i1:417-608(+)